MTDSLLAGRYRRERLLGAGAMGQVWLAADQLLDRQVAIKNVALDRAMSGLATPVQQDLLTRIRREAQLAARLNHPNAVSVYDLVTVDDRPYVVMEYVAGSSLADEIREAGVLDPARVAALGAMVADALAEAHASGIVHRDVKPANILVGPRGVPKLADFGIARITDDGGATATGLLMGTPAYVAPEVVRGAYATPASDIWSLGVTLHAALSGRSPFSRGSDDAVVAVLGRVLDGTVTPPPGGAVADVVMRMLQIESERRPSAGEVAAALRRAADERRDDRSTRRAFPPFLGPGVPAAQPGTAAPPPPSLSAVPSPDPVPVPPPAVPPPAVPPPVAPVPAAPVSTAAEPPRTRGRGVLVASVVAALAAALAVVAAVLVVHRSSPGASSQRSPVAAASSSAQPAPVHVTQTETSTIPAPAVVAQATPSPTPSSAVSNAGNGQATYSYVDAVNAMHVNAPAGMIIEPDTAEITSSNRWHDFIYQDANDRWHEPYLHLGVGNPHPTPTIASEVAGAIKGIRDNTKFYDIVFQPARYTTYCGTQAADLEFTEKRHGYDIPRHAELRIWISNSETLIVEIDSPQSLWPEWAPVFDGMVASCATS